MGSKKRSTPRVVVFVVRIKKKLEHSLSLLFYLSRREEAWRCAEHSPERSEGPPRRLWDDEEEEEEEAMPSRFGERFRRRRDRAPPRKNRRKLRSKNSKN